MAIIYNAKDHHPAEIRRRKYLELKEFLNKNELNFFDVDLRNYFKNHEGLRPALEKANVIWVNGGNTFRLRYAMAESGFDQIIKSLIEKGITYAGDSAGSIVAGPTLEGFENADDPKQAPEVITDGLALTDIIVLPHWDDPVFKSALKQLQKRYKDDKSLTIPLRNDQAIFVTDSEYKIG